MKEEIKVKIENLLNDCTKQNLVRDLRWILHAIPLCDIRDVAIGYIVGIIMDKVPLLYVLEENDSPTEKEMIEIIEIIQQRLPNILDKIEKDLTANL